ncbi:PAS domain-containing protein [Conexibacter sp. JD483]|uniref:PAS domain-containing protein n=1 Tax=unclassified Conexibacter TaxID=2627773 RepID=UPI00271ED7FD|nr:MULTISPECIES: PAS domain-containing protein [unclassified Conexibacter]MDO8185467.1 PAS domain-containing protein [Conexibacter sp. CPCC 205706]MDO8197346.1 PAS domain-containing protein [Conexibacter sp. CPCC 205762]MDR9372815.1 PAS domain-containing protein [Conexibacter sp. JD483]
MALARRHLSIVPTTTEEARPSRWFCGHCGAVTDEAPAPVARVCGECDLGLLMEASADLVPRPREPYLIVDASLAVQALSAEAARFLAISEQEAIERPVTDLLIPADAEAASAHHFAQTIMHVAAGDDELRRLVVRPADVFGVRMPLRVGVCGPPRGALLVIE